MPRSYTAKLSRGIIPSRSECTDGVLIYRDGTFTKVTNPQDPYSRSGNQAGTADSPYVLADYKTDKGRQNLSVPEKFAIMIRSTARERYTRSPKESATPSRSMGPRA